MSEPNATPAGAHLRESFYATKPTPFTVWTRTFLPWQLVRFAVINLRMFVVIGKSHRGQH
ncbi:MAG: hypothetical protein U0704_05355 [Candidatus Eisenbacteria bacterium]